MVGDRPGAPGRKFMNMEISGLPLSGPHRAKLMAARTKFKNQFLLGPTGPRGYEDLEVPLPVKVTGSLFFDMDHCPPADYVGHQWMQPRTAWEVHPITEIEFNVTAPQ
jgi:hypothetical protein